MILLNTTVVAAVLNEATSAVFSIGKILSVGILNVSKGLSQVRVSCQIVYHSLKDQLVRFLTGTFDGGSSHL